MSLAFPPDGAIAAQKVTRANAYKTRRETPARPAAVSDACRPGRPRAVSRREYTGSRAVKSIGGRRQFRRRGQQKTGAVSAIFRAESREFLVKIA
ncbi:MAG: hypothetical protein MPL62_07420 [Alphaproteobacteria bacterium]|nr:hypothetical protein [Alphaproteobacteria bacterium]